MPGGGGGWLNKNSFRPNVSSRTSVDVFFDGDYEFDIIFGETCNEKIKIAKHEPVLA
jgi:hypothetical protein